MHVIAEKDALPVKVWADEVEEGCLAQLANLSKLPFAYHHIAAMPDTHQGYGMPIGGVLATEGVVVPNAVGVDIGCFAGDTLIPLLDGTQRNVKSLAETDGQFWVYSLDDSGKLVPGRAEALRTRTNAPLVKVVINGGAEILCTPDHQFMLIDGSYREAEKLCPGDGLTPLYRTYATRRDGYESVITRRGKAVRTHQAVAEAVYGLIPKGYAVHHSNFNRFDNRPENLKVMTASAHSRVPHPQKVERLRSESFKQHRLTILRGKGFYSPDLAEKKAGVATKNITTYMRENPEHFAEAIRDNGKRGTGYLVAYNKSERGRQKSREIGNREYTCDICGAKGKGGFFLPRHLRKAHGNHKVVSVTPLQERADVYCLTVEKYHNFALSAGVFVHNCGVRAVKSGLTVETVKPKLHELLNQFQRDIPTGFNWHDKPQEWDGFEEDTSGLPVVNAELKKARLQLGTLGGGNHFIEVQADEEGHVWFMLHSGSRNLGKQVCDHYNKLAREINKRWHSVVDDKWELAFLPLNTDLGAEYMREMNFCLRFAKENRARMMQRVMNAVRRLVPEVEFDDERDIHHNYAAMEHHFSKNVLVHRKGAVKATGLVIIPGSMGSPSYIAAGKSNPDSFFSCSHGAGRRMGRKEATRQYTAQAVIEDMKALGIEIMKPKKADIAEECRQAYKDIDAVMAEQTDLVEPVVKLTPIGVVKA